MNYETYLQMYMLNHFKDPYVKRLLKIAYIHMRTVLKLSQFGFLAAI